MQLLVASLDVLLSFVVKSRCFIMMGEGKLNFKGLPCCSRRPPGGCPAWLQPRSRCWAEAVVVPPPLKFLVLQLFLFAGSKLFSSTCRELIFRRPLVLCLDAFGTTRAGVRGCHFCFVLQDGARPGVRATGGFRGCWSQQSQASPCCLVCSGWGVWGS